MRPVYSFASIRQGFVQGRSPCPSGALKASVRATPDISDCGRGFLLRAFVPWCCKGDSRISRFSPKGWPYNIQPDLWPGRNARSTKPIHSAHSALRRCVLLRLLLLAFQSAIFVCGRSVPATRSGTCQTKRPPSHDGRGPQGDAKLSDSSPPGPESAPAAASSKTRPPGRSLTRLGKNLTGAQTWASTCCLRRRIAAKPSVTTPRIAA